MSANLRATLAAPDAVMEPSVLLTMQQFVQEKGTPVEIVQLLSEGYRGQAEMCNLAARWLGSISGNDEGESVRSVAENYLKSLLVERFDPRKADQILLEHSETSVLEWLRPMIEQHQYRTMIYQLSQENETCVLLNFAIQTICDAGYQKEIAGVATASKYVHVFSRVLVDAILQLHDEDESSLQERFHEFVKSSTGGPHTFLYVQNLLKRAYDETKALWMERISEELARSILYHGRVAMHLNNFVAGYSEQPRLADNISSMIEAGATSAEDMMSAHADCLRSPAESLPALHQSRFIDLLLLDLFNRDKSVQPHLRSKYIWVLAAAASSSPEEIPSTQAALEKIDNYIQQNLIGLAFQKSVQDVLQLLTQPIVAHALLVWLKYTIGKMDYYTNNWTTTSIIPDHYVLLEEIAVRFPLMRPHVFRIFEHEFENPPDGFVTMQLTTFRKMLVDRFLFLISLGWVTPVLRLLLKNVQVVDLAIYTYFVDRLFSIAELPFSPQMSSLLLQLLLQPSIQSMLLQHPQAPLVAFLDHCQRLDTLNPDLRSAVPDLVHRFVVS